MQGAARDVAFNTREQLLQALLAKLWELLERLVEADESVVLQESINVGLGFLSIKVLPRPAERVQHFSLRLLLSD